MQIETERLRLRPWQERDVAPFSDINADPEVRRYYYPSILTPAETADVIAECDAHLRQHGFAFVALERKTDAALVGGLGLSIASDEIPGGPHIEIGWILGRPYWRNGYALEAAGACLEHAWRRLGLNEVIGYTSRVNDPSRALMEKLGMLSDPAEDFDDATVPVGNPLRPHVLYRARPNG